MMTTILIIGGGMVVSALAVTMAKVNKMSKEQKFLMQLVAEQSALLHQLTTWGKGVNVVIGNMKQQAVSLNKNMKETNSKLEKQGDINTDVAQNVRAFDQAHRNIAGFMIHVKNFMEHFSEPHFPEPPDKNNLN